VSSRSYSGEPARKLPVTISRVCRPAEMSGCHPVRSCSTGCRKFTRARRVALFDRVPASPCTTRFAGKAVVLPPIPGVRGRSPTPQHFPGAASCRARPGTTPTRRRPSVGCALRRELEAPTVARSRDASRTGGTPGRQPMRIGSGTASLSAPRGTRAPSPRGVHGRGRVAVPDLRIRPVCTSKAARREARARGRPARKASGGRPTTHRPRRVHRGQPERSCAWWRARSAPGPAKITRWSPTMSPPRTTLKPIAPVGWGRWHPACIHRRGVERRLAPRHGPTETESGATGRVHLVAVVRFDDLGVVARVAASSASLNSRFTPRLMFGAITMGRRSATCAVRPAPGRRPVVPITIGTACARHRA
jgi:hypothetical protein